MTSDNIAINSTNFSVDKDGNMTCNNGTLNQVNIVGGRITLTGESGIQNFIINGPGNDYTRMNGHVIEMNCEHTGVGVKVDPRNSQIFIGDSNNRTIIYPTGIYTPTVTQTSKEENKKNFEKLQNGLDIINSTDIYKYNMKTQKDGDKKHIGFVIGDKYKYSEEITSEGNDGVDTYSMISVAYKAIQELAQQNEELQKEIQELKGEKDGKD